MQRILFALQTGYQYRQPLRHILQSTPAHQTLQNIDLMALKQAGIEALILDFDGVLAPHGDAAPLPELNGWFKEAIALFTAARIFILTNRPDPVRQAYFQQHYPGITFVTGVRKKPYPDGLYQVQRLTQVTMDRLVLFDDRLLTGVLAACLAGCQIRYIRQPYIKIQQRPLKELFFMGLRGLEKVFLR